MAMKQVIFVSFFAAAVFGSPVTKDLINDVFQAGRAVTFFDIEVTELSSRIDLFQSEVNLQLVSYANYIRTLLQNLQVDNYGAIDTMFTDGYNKINADIEALDANLDATRSILLTINRNLEDDLASLPPNVEALKTSVAAGDQIYAGAETSLQTSVTDIEAAITLGIGDQENEDVTRVWVQWTHIKDVLLNERFLTDNVKLVYDVRAQDAFTALDVVVGQVPAK